MDEALDIENEIQKLIDKFINDPNRLYGTGEGSSTKSLKTIILPDGRIMDIQIRITTFKKEIILLNSDKDNFE